MVLIFKDDDARTLMLPTETCTLKNATLIYFGYSANGTISNTYEQTTLVIARHYLQIRTYQEY